MSKRQILMLLGALAIALPSPVILLPGRLETIITVLNGLAIVIIAYRLRIQSAAEAHPDKVISQNAAPFLEYRATPPPQTASAPQNMPIQQSAAAQITSPQSGMPHA